MKDQTRRKTLSDEAYEAICARIIDGRLSAGSRLVVTALANELQLSATPINEALAALDREGMVSYAPHRGYSVRQLTVGDVDQVFTVREAIEALAVQLTAEHADDATLAELEGLLAQGDAAVRKQDFEAFYELDMAFHHALYRASGNSLLERIAELIHGQMHLLVAKAAYTPGRFRGAQVEHEAVMRCIRERKPEAAEEAM